MALSCLVFLSNNGYVHDPLWDLFWLKEGHIYNTTMTPANIYRPNPPLDHRL